MIIHMPFFKYLILSNIRKNRITKIEREWQNFIMNWVSLAFWKNQIIIINGMLKFINQNRNGRSYDATENCTRNNTWSKLSYN